MKKVNFIIFIFFIISCNSSLEYLNQFDGYNGKPKKIESTTYKVEYKDSVATEKMAYKNIEFYDSKGRKIKTLRYKSDGSPSTGGTHYNYDKFGNLIKYIMYNRDSTINIENHYKYDNYGNEIERVSISGNRKITTKRIYDRKNNTVKIIGKNSDGSFKHNAIQRYDKQWRKIELISYDTHNKQKSRIKFFYDKKGNEIQSKWYNSENKLHTYYISTYNFNNDRIRIEEYHIRNGEYKLVNDTKIEYKYDEKGNCIEKLLIFNGKASWITKNEYKYFW